MSSVFIFPEKLAEQRKVSPSVAPVVEDFLLDMWNAVYKNAKKMSKSKEIQCVHLTKSTESHPFAEAFCRARVVGAAFDLPE